MVGHRENCGGMEINVLEGIARKIVLKFPKALILGTLMLILLGQFEDEQQSYCGSGEEPPPPSQLLQRLVPHSPNPNYSPA